MIRVRLLPKTKDIVRAMKADPRGGACLLMVVYHRGHRATVRRIDQGFQPTPWRCPKCRATVARPDELRYCWAVRAKAVRP